MQRRITAADAAQLLGVDVSRVRLLCSQRRLNAMKVGATWWITTASVMNFERKPPGPKKKGKP